MSHRAQMEFVASIRKMLPEYFTGVTVLEVGSLDVNGSVRPYFTDCDYLGLDLRRGPGVDLDVGGHRLRYPDDWFNTAISCEAFEHDRHWAATFQNMVRMTSGLVLFTCAGLERQEHGTHANHPTDSPFTLDYYHNLSPADFERECDFSKFRELVWSENGNASDLYFWGLTR